jgi:hypothetical protein
MTGAMRKLNVSIAEDEVNLLQRYTKPYPIKDCPDFVDGNIKLCFTACLGLILIHKTVFEKVEFTYFKDSNALPDLIFAGHLWQLAIYNWVDTSIYSTHENTDWAKTRI